MACTAQARGYSYEGSTRKAIMSHFDEDAFQWIKAGAIEADRSMAAQLRYIVRLAIQKENTK